MIKKLVAHKKLLLMFILVVGMFFRFADLNWDQNQHLHPDERFLTMVGTDMKLPRTFADYLDPATSPYNPANIGHDFYVYGTFPVVLNELIGYALHTNDYNSYALMGRLLSGAFDVLLVLILFKIGELFEEKYKLHPHVKFWAAFFYAIAVLPIQLSHFFAVDTFLNTFVFLSFYASLKYSFSKHGKWLLLCGVFLGLAIASKITAVFIAPLLLYFFVNAYSVKGRIARKNLLRLFGDLILFGVTTYLVGRIADPYLFQTGNLFDLRPNQLFLDNLKQLQGWSNPQAWFPPGVQWIHKTPVFFALKNLVIYGIGIGFTICVPLGFYYLWQKVRRRDLFVIFVWVLLYFLYQSLQTTQTMRYFLILYPFLALFAGIGFTYFSKQTNKIVSVILLLFVVIWPLLFFSIYTKPHSRISATQWIYLTIPAKSTILTESWDDALPLPFATMWPTSIYNIIELPVFDPDTSQKWQKMNGMFAKGDYLILSSNRGWGSIPTVPERYPQMTKFYQDLFANKTQYKKITEFTSYPSLSYLGIPLTIPDDNAEEAFTVYDHPKVLIFKHIR